MHTISQQKDRSLIAHLLRRAGFGATPSELEIAVELGYDEVVNQLLNPDQLDVIPEDMIRRFHKEQSDMRGLKGGPGAHWVYRMAMTNTPLREKMCLFWHRLFATAHTKLIQGGVVKNQIDMFRSHGMGRFDNLLLRVAKDPSMIMWLDNQDNHAGQINENFGREVLELFSMGVGNYSEEDIKETARAFTGWRIINPEYMSIKMNNNTMRPFGYMKWQFEYDDNDHDHGRKTILGETGNWNGQDAIRIICDQEATARFLSRHLYHFFVADEPPVSQWPHEPPGDPKAIDMISKSYLDSDHNITAMLTTIFKSDFFRADSARYSRIKSPTEMVIGSMRLAGPIDLPSDDHILGNDACTSMGQSLLKPPSVEGWQGGMEWINTGSYVERINFVSQILRDYDKIGIRNLITRIKEYSNSSDMTSYELVDNALDVFGPLEVTDHTRNELKAFASKYGSLNWSTINSAKNFDNAALSVIQLIVSCQEYQMA